VLLGLQLGVLLGVQLGVQYLPNCYRDRNADVQDVSPSSRFFETVAYSGILFGGRGSSTNSVVDRGQRKRGSGGGSSLVRGSAQFANE
jgi:hypothetical protein